MIHLTGAEVYPIIAPPEKGPRRRQNGRPESRAHRRRSDAARGSGRRRRPGRSSFERCRAVEGGPGRSGGRVSLPPGDLAPHHGLLGVAFCPTAKITPVPVYSSDLRPEVPIAFAVSSRTARPSWAGPASGESSTMAVINASVLPLPGLLA